MNVLTGNNFLDGLFVMPPVTFITFPLFLLSCLILGGFGFVGGAAIVVAAICALGARENEDFVQSCWNP